MKHCLLFAFLILPGLSNAQESVNIDRHIQKLYSTPVDVGVIEIILPQYHNIYQNKQFTVRVKNFGTDTIFGFNLDYSQGNHQNGIYWSDTLLPSEVDTAFLPMLTLNPGTETICAYTNLSSDTVSSNDGICKDVHLESARNLNYFDDFESYNYFMKDTSMLQSTQWLNTQPQGTLINNAFSGQNCWVTASSTISSFVGTDMLYSPPILLDSSGVDSIGFKHFYYTVQNDAAYVEYLDSNGVWKILGKVNDTAGFNWYTDTINSQPCFSGFSGKWVHSAICVDQMHYPDIDSLTRFRFVYSSDGSNDITDGWAVDDFYVKKPQIPKDAGITEIQVPSDSCHAGVDQQIRVRIQNFGPDTLFTIPVVYTIDGDSSIHETWTGTLLPDSSTVYSFSQAYRPSHVGFNICAYSALSADELFLNDTTCKQVHVIKAGQDAGIVDIFKISFYPPDTTDMTESVDVLIRIRNFGTDTLYSLPVEYAYKKDSFNWITEIWTGVLIPGDTVVYDFNQNYTTGMVGHYDICARTMHKGDSVTANNKYCERWLGIVGSAVERQINLPGFELHHIAPNPTSNNTTLRINVPYQGSIKMKALDILGRKVYLEETKCTQGENHLNLDMSSWSNGVYVLIINFDGYRLQTKVVKAE